TAGHSATWISETELASGEIPASIRSDIDLGIPSDPVSAIVERLNPHLPTTLNRGSVVFAPTVDRAIETPFGTIDIDAGSLVLVLSVADLVAVYDLDDRHRGAVSISVHGQRFTLHPGIGVVVTSQAIKSFDQINPAQHFGYRDVIAHEVDGGLRAFSCE